MLRAAKAWALLAGRTYVLPEDVQAVLGACVPHRLAPGNGGGRLSEDEVRSAILHAVPVT